MTLVLQLVVACAAILAIAWFFLWMPGRSYAGNPPGTSPDGILEGKLRGHVEALAGGIGVRNAADPEALERAAEYVAGQLTAAGYTIDDAAGRYEAHGRSFRNIVAVLPGAEKAEEVVVVGAHYDTDENSPGADDNASGVAALIELARMLREKPPRTPIRFVAFTNEEEPYFQTPEMGSFRYAAKLPPGSVRVMLSLETLGCWSNEEGSQRLLDFFGWGKKGNFLAFVGDVQSRDVLHRAISMFRRRAMVPSHGAVVPQWVPGANWSDHWSFWKHGIDALMITDTALLRNKRYHRRSDTPDTLDYPVMTQVVVALEKVIRELAS